MALPFVPDPEALEHGGQSCGQDPAVAPARALAFLRAARGPLRIIDALAARGPTHAEDNDGWQLFLRVLNYREPPLPPPPLQPRADTDGTGLQEETIEGPSCDQGCDESCDQSCDESCDMPDPS